MDAAAIVIWRFNEIARRVRLMTKEIMNFPRHFISWNLQDALFVTSIPVETETCIIREYLEGEIEHVVKSFASLIAVFSLARKVCKLFAARVWSELSMRSISINIPSTTRQRAKGSRLGMRCSRDGVSTSFYSQESWFALSLSLLVSYVLGFNNPH